MIYVDRDERKAIKCGRLIGGREIRRSREEGDGDKQEQ